MKTSMKKRIFAGVMAFLMVVGLLPLSSLNKPVDAKAADSALTSTAADLANGLKGMAIGTDTASIKVETNKMVIDEKSTTGGIGSNGKTNVAYIYLPVTLSGLYKITADVTVNSIVDRTEAQTMAGVFIGVTTDETATSPFVTVAARGDGTNNMYRQKANGTYGGSSGSTGWTVGTKETLGLERRLSSGANKFYSTLDGADMKNTNDVAASLLAEDFSGQVFIAVSGANVTIENLKIVNGDGAVVYDQSKQEVVAGPVELTSTSADLDNELKGLAIGTDTATVKVETNKMVIDEKSTTGGIGSNGKTNVAYIYLPVTLSGLYKITADVTVNSIVDRTEAQTMAGVFIGVTTDETATSPFVTVAARGDGTNNMYRQKANGTYGGSSGSTGWTVGTKETLGLERRLSSGANKFYSTLDGADMKNTNDVAASLLAEDFSGQVFIAVSGANVTIENLKIVNGDGAVVYDQSKVDVGGGSEPGERKAWSEVAAPVIGTPVQESGSVKVPFTMVIGNDGADRVTVTMTGDGDPVTKNYAAESTEGSVSFTPSKSGSVSFTITASREGEEDKAGNTVPFDYVLPLGKSTISSATSKGNGAVDVVYTAVAEATGYVVEYSADGTTWTATPEVTTLNSTVTGLTVGNEYYFRVVAKRGTDSSVSEAVKGKATADAQVVWSSLSYGNGASASKDKVTGNANDGTVNLYSESGKIVPGSTDGLVFHYTAVPVGTNFTLKAKVTVNSWGFNNGQEGFGLMATDWVGSVGGLCWTNSYMVGSSKSEYYYDLSTGEVTTDTSATKITNKNGILAQEKTGVTKENKSLLEANDTETVKNAYKSTMVPLDTVHFGIAGNTIGNCTNAPSDTIEDAFTEMYLTIQKNNTGYFLTFTDMAGNSTTKKYYVPDALEKVDSDYVYVGMYAARNKMDVTFSEIEFTTIPASEDAPAEERPVEKLAVNASMNSPKATGNANYRFKFTANCDGTLTIADAEGTALVSDVAVKAGAVVAPLDVVLTLGKNNYSYTFTPDPSYQPDENTVMASYEPVTANFSISYRTYGTEGQSLYVAPGAVGSGSKEDPMSIYDAFKYVQPGQTIVVMEGTYKMDSSIKVDRGIDGTADKMIKMVADPEAKTRPVFDFQKLYSGMVFAGNYWYLYGFDVTNTITGQKGLQLSGKNCVLDNIMAYHNGNTGIQLSRYLTTDEFDMWPSDNLILNCTSYGNADEGFEDADGFAAKLTVGNGNVFDGCIAYNNADDGWDLFAKVQTGSIGSVTIKNSVAYANGYLEDGTNAGNGNGFKLGGDSMSGYHVLENCVVFDNKAKGIDSNSCPDIQVKNCTTFNNGSYNVAFYTNNAANTDFAANGIISYRTQFTDMGENIKPVGSQDKTKYDNATNYFWNFTGTAYDASVTVKDDWFVSTDTKMDYSTHKYSELVITRNADNTINMNGLLELTDKAPADAGARMTGTPSSDMSKVPASVDTYKVTSGGNEKLVAKTEKEITIKIDAPFEKFVNIEVDDVVLDPAKYSASGSDSTTITFKASYIKSLKAGEHTVRVYFSDGKFAETKIIVEPNTGDSANIWLYVILLMAAMGAMGTAVVMKKKADR